MTCVWRHWKPALHLWQKWNHFKSQAINSGTVRRRRSRCKSNVVTKFCPRNFVKLLLLSSYYASIMFLVDITIWKTLNQLTMCWSIFCCKMTVPLNSIDIMSYKQYYCSLNTPITVLFLLSYPFFCCKLSLLSDMWSSEQKNHVICTSMKIKLKNYLWNYAC